LVAIGIQSSIQDVHPSSGYCSSYSQSGFGNSFNPNGTPIGNFKGSFDDIGIWNRVLTQQEITNLFNASMTSVVELSNSPFFAIYPNPATNIININSDAVLMGKNYILYDAVGRVVGSGIVATSTMSISLDGLSSGLYTLAIDEQYRRSFTVAK
jgi:hypothetical protein